MTNNNFVYVVPSEKGGWNVKVEDTELILGHYRNKADAVDTARDLARKKRVELVIHGKDGILKVGTAMKNDHSPLGG